VNRAVKEFGLERFLGVIPQLGKKLRTLFLKPFI
jgi:hypothetical protein